MSHLLEKQYKRGERARKKNKQEERKMVHEITGKNGLKALHEYRVEMVTREQRKVAEELERIREGLRMYKGQRWNAGARHKEAKRGLQITAITTAKPEQPFFSSAKPVVHRYQKKNDVTSSSTPTTIPGLPRAVKSGPFLTSRRPAPTTSGKHPAPGTISTPVSGRMEKQKVPRLHLNRNQTGGRDDAVTSSRSMGHVMGDIGGRDSSSDDSDSDDFDDSDDEGQGQGGKKRTPHPDILKAILQGVVKCWEDTVVTAADPMGGLDGGADRLLRGEMSSTAASIEDFLSPRGLGDKSDQYKDSNREKKEKKRGNALSLVLLRNMRANNVDKKLQVLETRDSSSSVNQNQESDRSPSTKPALFSKVNLKELGEKPSAVQRQKGHHGQSTPRLSSLSRQSDAAETVEEYVAQINKDLPQIQENTASIPPVNGEFLASSRSVHSSSSSINRKPKLPHSAQSSKSSKLSDHAKNIDRGGQRSYGRHVRTTNTNDSTQQQNKSRHGSGKSSRSERSMRDASGIKPSDKNRNSKMEQGHLNSNGDDEGDNLPKVSFRLPPLKTTGKSGQVSSRSARSSVSSFHDGRDSELSDARYDTENRTKNSNRVSLPRLPSAAEPTPESNMRNNREKLPTVLPRLPLSASVSSTPRLDSQRSTLGDDVDDTKVNNSVVPDGSQEQNGDSELSLDLHGKNANPMIRYKKKLHVYQKSPRSNNSDKN